MLTRARATALTTMRSFCAAPQRTCAVAGTAGFLENNVPPIVKAGMSVEAISVTSEALKYDFEAQLLAQDMQDALVASLRVPRGISPAVVGNSSAYKYMFVGWTRTNKRSDIIQAALDGGKDVISLPPATADDLTQIKDPQRRTMLWNPLVCLPAVGSAKTVVLGARELNDVKTRLTLRLRPPLFGAPTSEERDTFSWWHQRLTGGGAMGAAGVQSLDLLQFLVGANPVAVRAAFESRHHGGSWQVGNNNTIITAGDHCRFQCEYADAVEADVELAWGSEPGATDPAAQLEVVCVASGAGADETPLAAANINLQTGEMVLDQATQQMGATSSGLLESHAALVDALVKEQIHSGTGSLEDIATPFSKLQPYYKIIDACYKSWDDSAGDAFVKT